MSHPLLIAFIVFASVMYFTPGPNNIIVLSSGLNYGFRPTIRPSRGLPSVAPSWWRPWD